MSKEAAILVLYISTSIALLVFGIVYAIYIRFFPIRPTWVSVMWGTGAISLGEMAAIGGTLFIYGLWDDLWWMVFISPVALALAGIPMAYLQQRKWKDMTSHNDDVVSIWRDNDG